MNTFSQNQYWQNRCQHLIFHRCHWELLPQTWTLQILVRPKTPAKVCCNVFQRVAECCRVLQSVAVFWVAASCSMLQSVAESEGFNQQTWTLQILVRPKTPATVCSNMFQCVAKCCRVLQSVAVFCNGLQRVAVCYSVLQRVRASTNRHGHCKYLSVPKRRQQWVAVWCSMLWCVAVYCSVLQCVTESCSVVQCVAECCRVIQDVTKCCSVLQCVAVCCSVRGWLREVCILSMLPCDAACFSVLHCITL